MFVSEKLVFLELHKTGGTHIGRWLNDLLGGEQIGKHNRLAEHLTHRFIVGSVRNPWDWYVSLWAFGCAGHGSVYQQTIRRADVGYYYRQLPKEMGEDWLTPSQYFKQFCADLRKPVRQWRDSYADHDDPAHFQAWLKLVFDKSRRFDIAEGFGFSPVSERFGLITYRYLKLFTHLDDALYSDRTLSTFEGVKLAFEDKRLVNYIIRNENLEEELLEAIALAGYELSGQDRDRVLAAHADKTNASKRRSAAYYYDEETLSMVAEREQLIIESHGYKPPML